MKQQIIILSFLFFVAGLFLSPVQAAHHLDYLDDFEICPYPNPNRVLEEGYTCKVPTVKTYSYKVKDYDVLWTLVKKEEDKEIWAVDKPVNLYHSWAVRIYVGDVEEDGKYTRPGSYALCARKELVINGERIRMTVPELGFGVPIYYPEAPSFELLEHFNYRSVVPSRNKESFWTTRFRVNIIRDAYKGYPAKYGEDKTYVYHPPSSGRVYSTIRNTETSPSVRCVSRRYSNDSYERWGVYDRHDTP